MADRSLFISWTGIIPGRELAATKFFGETLAFYAKLVADGRLESFEPMLLEAHGAGIQGFFVLRGSEEQITALHKDHEFEHYTVRGQLVCFGLEITGGFINEGLARVMSDYEKAGAAFA